MNSFKLSDLFLDKFKYKQPDFGPLGYITYKTKYARPIKGENRTEEYWETCKRVVEGTYNIQKWHCEKHKLPWSGNKAQRSAQEMFALMWEFKFLPPGRGLWNMGTEIIWSKGSAPLYNCSFISSKEINLDFAEPFCFLMDMSMLGVGVGADTKGAGLITIKSPRQGDYTFVVEDSREGWVELIRVILTAYSGRGSLPKKIDYSQIRVWGKPIGSGGTSSGPKPLKQLAKDIPTILNPLIDEDITSTAIADIFNAIGRCVVSGNLRRSAELLLGSANDKAFLELKKNKKLLEQWRWASNNSVFAEIGMDYSFISEDMFLNGDPGFLWIETARTYGRLSDPPICDDGIEGTNPCGEIGLESFEFCNVPETFPARHLSFDEYKRTLKFAYLYAKTVTLLSTHNARVNAVQLRNRRIGLSMSGIIQNINKIGTREHFRWCDKGYEYLRSLDKLYSRWLCIPLSIKMVSVKPSGSVSLLPGATPGIHYPYAKYYWRTMRFDAGSEIVKALRKAGYRIEQAEGHNTVAAYFPVEEKDFVKSRKDISMWEQLELAAQMQYYWADNQVSVTVTFNKNEAEQIPQALQLYETRLKSVSFYPLEEGTFKHAPYQPMTKEEYEKAIIELKPIIIKDTTETDGFDKMFCDKDLCNLEQPSKA